ncbi:pyridoxal-phosphate dependent enzyme [Anaerolineales bacterium HSG6]|nr:pyridoxal-phosphate dependent enzyme [Anaerolineales bacterium HSG6]MDM8532135.1 pyridoxal-phosphate dependent enzyme [Anaerolineales bacterium HSG25]
MKTYKSYLTFVNCLECNQRIDFYPGLYGCPHCGSPWLDAQYDYETVAKLWQNGVDQRLTSLWKYSELLPIQNAEKIVSMGEGQSPLVRAEKIQRRLKHPNIFLKDERQSPTSSFKDRQAAVAVSAMKEAGIRECVLASTGNAAVAYASYCARASIKLWIFLTSLVPAAKMREAALYGAEVIKVTGTYDQAKKIASDFASRKGIHFDKGAKAIPGKESMKTIAFEIAEELAIQQGGNLPWQAPDWFIQAVSGGIGPIGALKGFEELYNMGLTDRIPKIGVVQVHGCSPMVQAFVAGEPTAKPVIPETRITVLSTGAPGFGYEILYKANQTYGGYMLSVSDDEAFDSMRHLARTEGYSVEPATAVAFAGLDKIIQQGVVDPNELVIVNCSGHTFPVEKHIMEEDVLDVRISGAQTKADPGVPIDGLGEALKRLDEQVTTIVVVDDNAMDRRLVRRLLQAKKPYRVFEAESAMEGLQMIRERLPDLIVSDLNMPGMDGFALLEELKKDPQTAHIPVIVVSAKDLTIEDKNRLAGQTSSIWLKGAFSTKDLVEHVVGTLSHIEQSQDDEKTVVPASSTKPTIKVDKVPSEPEPVADSAVKRVVLIDDNPNDARLISRLLQTKYPLDIKQVQFGRDALAIIRQEKPHLIVLDLVIPDMSGFDVLTELRNDETLDSIPVVVVTSKDLSDEEKELLAANQVFSMWQKGKIDRQKLVADVEAQLT